MAQEFYTDGTPSRTIADDVTDMSASERLLVQRQIAAQIDYPSVYMGGPSHGAMKKAERIIAAKLATCETCGERPRAHVDTVGMWSAACRCGQYNGPDYLGCETWQELVCAWHWIK